MHLGGAKMQRIMEWKGMYVTIAGHFMLTQELLGNRDCSGG